MKDYYVNMNAQSNGDHEVHKEGCYYVPPSRKYVGSFYSCRGVVEEAKKTYPKSNGCKYCCKECHTS